MKANEIMIGDWLRLRYKKCLTGEEIVKDFRVSEIRDDYGDMCVWSKESGNMGEIDPRGRKSHIEPIQLTAEILEENGFTRLGTAYILKERHFGLENPSIPSNYLDNYWLRVSIKAVHIEYIHQLQQALRLCGIEKEIML